MGKIVYLLGAGASFGTRADANGGLLDFKITKRRDGHNDIVTSYTCANILSGMPIITELPCRIGFMLSKVWEILNRFEPLNMSALMVETLAENLEWMQKESARNTTVDTFAKKLWVTNRENDYNRLKLYLSLYFMFEQMTGKVDPRYDAFFASILGDSIHDFPNNVSILSWNYDCQLELALSEYVQGTSLEQLQAHLGTYMKPTANRDVIKVNGFNVIKLNGSALLADSDTKQIFDPFYNREGKTPLGYLAQLQGTQRFENLLSFAWENMNSTFEKQIHDSIHDATTLIIIGYSFPYFNRRVDQFLFGTMPSLTKIYIQDIEPDKVEESINNLLSDLQRSTIKIEKKNNVNQFYLPAEL